MTQAPFSRWTLQDLEQTFELERLDELPELNEWLNRGGELSERDLATLEELRLDVFRQAAYWSEEELKFYLIAPLIHLAEFKEPLRFFAGRLLTATVGDYELSGVVDGMVATGHYHPQTPYFCLHEYKPEEAGRQADPAARPLPQCSPHANSTNRTHRCTAHTFWAGSGFLWCSAATGTRSAATTPPPKMKFDK